MWIIWDIVTVAIVLLFACSSYRKGFLYAITRLAGAVGAFLFSLYYSLPLAQMLYQNYLRAPLLETVTKHMATIGQNSFDAFVLAIEELLASLPTLLSHPLAGMLNTSAEKWYQTAQGGDMTQLPAIITDTMIAPIAIGLVRVLVFCLIFAVLMLLVNLVAGLLKSVNHLPIIGSFNELLGGILGGLQGVLYVFVLASLLWLIVSSVGDADGFLSHEQIGQTYLFRYFYEAGPWAKGLL